MTPSQALASKFPYKPSLVDEVVGHCEGDIEAAEWILEFFVMMYGPSMLNLFDWKTLVTAAKHATQKVAPLLVSGAEDA